MSQVNHNYSYIHEVDGFTVWERLRNIRNFLTERKKAFAVNDAKRQQIKKKHKIMKERHGLWNRELERRKKQYINDSKESEESVKEKINNYENEISKLTALITAFVGTEPTEHHLSNIASKKHFEELIETIRAEFEEDKELTADNFRYEQLDIEEKISDIEHDIENYHAETMDLDSLMNDCQNEIDFLTDMESKLAAVAEESRVPGKTDKEMYEINFIQEARIRLFNRATAELSSHGRLSTDTIHYLRKDLSVCKELMDRTDQPPLKLMLEQIVVSGFSNNAYPEIPNLVDYTTTPSREELTYSVEERQALIGRVQLN